MYINRWFIALNWWLIGFLPSTAPSAYASSLVRWFWASQGPGPRVFWTASCRGSSAWRGDLWTFKGTQGGPGRARENLGKTWEKPGKTGENWKKRWKLLEFHGFLPKRRKIGENHQKWWQSEKLDHWTLFFFFEVGKVRDGWLLVGGFKHGFYFPFFISDME